MKKQSKTIVVNLFSGPGTGKSILSKDLFSFLKKRHISCEESDEYIKKKLYEEAQKTIQNQDYLFAKQNHQLFRLLDKVDIIITDAPLPFFTIYDRENCEALKALVLKRFNSYNNINIFIERDLSVPYETAGRYQTLEEAMEVDNTVKQFLVDEEIKHYSINGINHIEYVYELIQNYGKG